MSKPGCIAFDMHTCCRSVAIRLRQGIAACCHDTEGLDQRMDSIFGLIREYPWQAAHDLPLTRLACEIAGMFSFCSSTPKGSWDTAVPADLATSVKASASWPLAIGAPLAFASRHRRACRASCLAVDASAVTKFAVLAGMPSGKDRSPKVQSSTASRACSACTAAAVLPAAPFGTCAPGLGAASAPTAASDSRSCNPHCNGDGQASPMWLAAAKDEATEESKGCSNSNKSCRSAV